MWHWALGRRELFGFGASGIAGGVAGATGSKAVTSAYGRRELRRRAAAHVGRVNRMGAHQVVWSGDPARRAVALTFDDGPTPELTPRILDALAEVEATATFFMMGYNVVQHRGLAERVVAEGHEIGVHTAEHLDPAVISAEETVDQVKRGYDAVSSLHDVRWFRPPRGSITGSVLHAVAELDLDVAMWSLAGRPAPSDDVDGLVTRLAELAQPGDIFLGHDGIGRATFDPDSGPSRDLLSMRELEARALPSVLGRWRDSGFELVSLSELVG